ncbi:MAG: Mth938-like domain-containing protein [Woeseiaceae bacterium]
MKFVREANSAITVRHVEKGMLRIGNEEVSENVVLFRESIQRGFDAADVATLREEDFAELIAEGPEVVIFGTGWKTCLPPRELVFALARRGIGFECMDTPAACRTFNILLSEDRDVAAVLMVTDGD